MKWNNFKKAVDEAIKYNHLNDANIEYINVIGGADEIILAPSVVHEPGKGETIIAITNGDLSILSYDESSVK